MTRLQKLLLGVALVSAMVIIAAVSNSKAQDNPGNPSILRAVQQLQVSANNIATQLTSLTNEVNIIGNQVGSLTTAPAVIGTGLEFKPVGFSGGCSAQNVGNSSVTVKMELLTIDGVVLQNPPNFVLAPGTGNGVGQPLGSAKANVWCRFTMINGSSADIRANLDISSDTTGLAAVVREAR
jgi:hypothetical protein